MTSRERVNLTLGHHTPDRVPLDLGASAVTDMHVSAVYNLRQALGLDSPRTPVKVVEPYQMLGEIAPDLMDALGVDVVGLGGPRTLFGFENKGWKDWQLFDVGVRRFEISGGGEPLERKAARRHTCLHSAVCESEPGYPRRAACQRDACSQSGHQAAGRV